ncbi:hypothetical protein JCM6882_000587 [Rhodosporidiobolus microsporus]
MAYQHPRPYRPHDLRTPSSFDSLHPPPSAPYSAHSSGETSPASSSDMVDGAFATLQGQGKRQQRQMQEVGGGAGWHHQHQQQQQLYQNGGRALPAAPPVHPKEERINTGGTGLLQTREDPKVKRKRVTIMCCCALVIIAIVALTVLGCKGML